MHLAVAPGILEEIIAHSRAAYPAEACGLLVGAGTVDRFVPMRNFSSNPQQFEMDPAELITELRRLRESNDELLAIFHSHPYGPAEPSKTDVEQAYYPQAAHLIVSLAEPDRPQTAAFRIIDGEVLAIELHVIV
jgi:proteasome lid subunit RPN8/RPN11